MPYRVALQKPHIAAVGSLEELRIHFAGTEFTIDRRFAGKVIMPDFIDPHIHPTIAATILPINIVSAMSWPLRSPC